MSIDHAPLYVFVPCHNRKAITRSFIQHFHTQLPKEYCASIHLLDDGSTDGTGATIARQWPNITIHRLNGQAYWGGCLRYIQNYCLSELPADIDPIVLIANDDIQFQENALERGLSLMRSREINALMPVLVDVPHSIWGRLDLFKENLDGLRHRDELLINYGDQYNSTLNHYSRLAKPGATNIGVTAALLIRRSCLMKSALVPQGLPHYGSDFWLTHSLACAGEKLYTHASYVVLRRQESTRPSSRALGRRRYWQQCCNPSSPDYLPASIVFQRKFSQAPRKALDLWVLTLKYAFMKLISGKEDCHAELGISLSALILARQK